MKRLRQACAVAITMGIASGAMASTLFEGPAEKPPETFTGRQFVDSEGCVFIRATLDGQVAWVPRLTRERTVLCGFEPTFGADAIVAEGSLPTPAPDLPPEVDAHPAEALAQTPEPAPAPAAEPAAPRPVRVAEATPAPAPVIPRRRVSAPRYDGVPAGYRPVWKDDRLNPHRGPRTATGDAAMARIWTGEVPMRLSDD